MAFGFFKKKKKETGKDNRYYQLTVREVEKVAKDAVNLVFEKPDGPFNYKPGQFITIIDTVNGEKLRRAYSLSTSPFVDDYASVTVKRVEGGKMSNHINDNYSVGYQVQVMEPMGLFTTEYHEDAERNVVLFGGGSGITPLFSIIKSLLNKEKKTKVSLVYGNRSEEYIIFKDQLAALALQHANFSLFHMIEDESSALADYPGRPNEEMMLQIVTDLNIDSETEIYICGPQPMMDIIVSGLGKAKIKKHQIRMESFQVGVTSPEELSEDTSENTSEVSITLDGQDFSITIDKSMPILAQALSKDLDMPYSCQSGLCTACRGKCVEGEVSVDDAQGLTQEELDEGYVLTCVGKALTDKVRIEIG